MSICLGGASVDSVFMGMKLGVERKVFEGSFCGGRDAVLSLYRLSREHLAVSEVIEVPTCLKVKEKSVMTLVFSSDEQNKSKTKNRVILLLWSWSRIVSLGLAASVLVFILTLLQDSYSLAPFYRFLV